MDIVFADKSVTLDTFIDLLADRLAPILKKKLSEKRDVISQREAYRTYGECNIKRWLREGVLEPFSKRPGKIEYKVEDIEPLYKRPQDYFV